MLRDALSLYQDAVRKAKTTYPIVPIGYYQQTQLQPLYLIQY